MIVIRTHAAVSQIMTVSSFCRHVLILFLVFLCLLQYGLTQEGNSCTNPNNIPGQCILLSTCPPLYTIFQNPPLSRSNAAFLRNSQCGYVGREPLVCCPRQNNEGNAGRNTNNQPGLGLSLLPRQNECGPYSVDKIVGGNETDITDYPWTVLIEYTRPNGQTSFGCGGSLINNRYVLTAAHCIVGTSIPAGVRASSIRLGEWNLTTERDCAGSTCNDPPVNIPIEATIVHPDYQRSSLDQKDDIALIRMTRPVQYTRWIQPVCLPAISDRVTSKNFANEEPYIAGWGSTETSNQSPVKLQLRVPVISDSRCASTYQSQGVNIASSQMCAGGRRGEDSCLGDSGGPMMSPETENRRTYWFLIGVVSFGPSRCGTPGWPGIYTRVSSYNNWITQNIRA